MKSCGLNLGSGKIKIAKVRREDWAESWKRHFKPIEIGNALLVKPSWIKRRPRKNQAVVILDPGLSFGTGQHRDDFVLSASDCGGGLRPSKTALTGGRYSQIVFGHRHGFGNFGNCGGQAWLQAGSRI